MKAVDFFFSSIRKGERRKKKREVQPLLPQKVVASSPQRCGAKVRGLAPDLAELANGWTG